MLTKKRINIFHFIKYVITYTKKTITKYNFADYLENMVVKKITTIYNINNILFYIL